MTKIKQFTVQADTETGQWIEGTLEYIQMVDIGTESETRAIEVCWVS